jgi:hypothetical protein
MKKFSAPDPKPASYDKDNRSARTGNGPVRVSGPAYKGR